MIRYLRWPLPAVLLLLLLAPGDVHANEALQLPAGEMLTLDGVPQERFWGDAARPRLPDVDVPGIRGPAKAAVDLRITTVDGKLAVGVMVSEDPGTAMGLHLFVADATARSAGDAISIDFRPVEPRSARLAVRGPRGVGRKVYRVEGAADWTQKGEWSAELAVPLVDLVGEQKDAPLRIAVVVYTRTPNVIASWPEGSRWHGPATWATVTPQGGQWVTSVAVNEERLAREDEADAKRAEAWLAFLKGMAKPVSPLAAQADVEAHIVEKLFGPLARVQEHRPDLEVPLACLRGDIYLRLGRTDAAAVMFEGAHNLAPGWREAEYGAKIKLARAGFARPGEATDYAAARSALATKGDREPGFEEDGLLLREALLAYREGRFDDAIPVLEALSKRYPHDAFIGSHAGFARKAKGLAAGEGSRAEQDKKKSLPRATIRTKKGEIVLELFQDDAPNTVNNFVYLAQKKFYDGVAIHRTVPMFLVQTGDALTKSEDPALRDRVGTGTAGYAVRSEKNERALIRGMVAMANAGADTESSQFFFTTGTAVHLQGDQTVFARVVAGQDVLESLVKGDRIEGITLSGLDKERRYHPTDASGRPAPEPAAR